MIRFGALLAASAALCQPAWASDLYLVCLGAGSANRQQSSSAYLRDNYGNSAWGQVVGTRTVPFDDQVNVEIVGEEARIRMPRTMLPPLHGGEDGWMKVKKLEINEREITGSVAVNFINSPKLRIDRMTGTISLNGKSGDYSGRCQSYDPSTAKPQF